MAGQTIEMAAQALIIFRQHGGLGTQSRMGENIA